MKTVDVDAVFTNEDKHARDIDLTCSFNRKLQFNKVKLSQVERNYCSHAISK